MTLPLLYRGMVAGAIFAFIISFGNLELSLMVYPPSLPPLPVLLYDQVRRWRPDAPLREAVYSHHHVDHVFGTKRFEEEAASNGWPRPTVYGHHDLPDHFDRYLKTRGWNRAIRWCWWGRRARASPR